MKSCATCPTSSDFHWLVRLDSSTASVSQFICGRQLGHQVASRRCSCGSHCLRGKLQAQQTSEARFNCHRLGLTDGGFEAHSLFMFVSTVLIWYHHILATVFICFHLLSFPHLITSRSDRKLDTSRFPGRYAVVRASEARRLSKQRASANKTTPGGLEPMGNRWGNRSWRMLTPDQ